MIPVMLARHISTIISQKRSVFIISKGPYSLSAFSRFVTEAGMGGATQSLPGTVMIQPTAHTRTI